LLGRPGGDRLVARQGGFRTCAWLQRDRHRTVSIWTTKNSAPGGGGTRFASRIPGHAARTGAPTPAPIQTPAPGRRAKRHEHRRWENGVDFR
jgi:hypothetical protein